MQDTCRRNIRRWGGGLRTNHHDNRLTVFLRVVHWSLSATGLKTDWQCFVIPVQRTETDIQRVVVLLADNQPVSQYQEQFSSFLSSFSKVTHSVVGLIGEEEGEEPEFDHHLLSIQLPITECASPPLSRGKTMVRSAGSASWGTPHVVCLVVRRLVRVRVRTGSESLILTSSRDNIKYKRGRRSRSNWCQSHRSIIFCRWRRPGNLQEEEKGKGEINPFLFTREIERKSIRMDWF